MATSHHGEDPDQDLVQRFIDQAHGKATREFPHGRVGGDDDGSLAYAIATDLRHGIIRMQFPKPVSWLGLGVKEAKELAEELQRRALAIQTAGT